MQQLLHRCGWILEALIASLLVAAFVLCANSITSANAVTQADIDRLSDEVEASSAAYKQALTDVANLEEDIAENQALLAQLSADLPVQEQRFNDAVCFMYKYQMDTSFLLDFLFSANNFEDLISTVEYINRLQESNYQTMVETAAYKAQVEAVGNQLASDLQAAEDARNQAADSLEKAKAARQEAMRIAAEEAAAQEAARKAAEAAAAASSGGGGGGGGGGGSSNRETPPSTDDVDWSLSREEFIAVWAPRINAYLSGFPLGGYGENFAAAAWDYGVDPRWSPAISCIESTKGKYCFKPHNAWGWGSKSWDSWEEAIDAHVNGLHRIYGVTLTWEAAQMYCPPTAESWYNGVLKEMKKI